MNAMEEKAAGIARCRRLLAYTPLQYMIDFAQENPGNAHLWMDDAREPQTCVLVLKHLHFIGGRYSTEAKERFSREALPAAAAGIRHLCVSAGDPAWLEAIAAEHPESCRRYERSLLRSEFLADLPEEASDDVVRITRELVEAGLENAGIIVDEVVGTATYRDMEDFYARGFGFAPVRDGRVMGFCTSEYPSAKAVAIGIEVSEGLRRRGVAKAMTRAFLHEAHARGLTVYWDCWKSNFASVRTAESCGFLHVADSPVLVIENRNYGQAAPASE